MALAGRFPQLTAIDTEIAVREIINAISRTLAKGHRIEIRGFGSFGLNYRPPRAGRNPKTGEQVSVREKYIPHFKAGKEMRERIDALTRKVPATEESRLTATKQVVLLEYFPQIPINAQKKSQAAWPGIDDSIVAMDQGK